MRKVFVTLALVFLSLGIAGCDSSDFKYIECVARDRTSNPCN